MEVNSCKSGQQLSVANMKEQNKAIFLQWQLSLIRIVLHYITFKDMASNVKKFIRSEWKHKNEW